MSAAKRLVKCGISVILNRPVIVSPSLNTFEKKVDSVMKKMEDSRSLLSDHELTHIKEEDQKIKRISALNKGTHSEFEKEEIDSILEKEDKWQMEFDQFKFIPLNKYDDCKQNIYRKCTERLYFVSQHNSDSSTIKYNLPWKICTDENEPLINLAINLLNQIEISEKSYYILSECPNYVYKYVYNKTKFPTLMKVTFK
ncbi:39S ribosomal protein L46, mitochondrial [Intoshia linei]|uniref:39S ribosomal protein L46, mitochondrial n=1 Tax=Intoshia linei TaxID=1819745 RepID=A0A177B8I2_9BILA|nr:39S ribosomal protein L46, mitochondrial [Intoshia linei]